jgi:diacylglycerol kinase family enzyme
MVINASGLGIELPLKEPINPKDGLLDLLLIKKDIPAAVNSLLALDTENIFQHWQGREISVNSEPQMEYWIDGEVGEQTPFTAVVALQALRYIAPQPKN